MITTAAMNSGGKIQKLAWNSGSNRRSFHRDRFVCVKCPMVWVLWDSRDLDNTQPIVIVAWYLGVECWWSLKKKSCNQINSCQCCWFQFHIQSGGIWEQQLLGIIQAWWYFTSRGSFDGRGGWGWVFSLKLCELSNEQKPWLFRVYRGL